MGAGGGVGAEPHAWGLGADGGVEWLRDSGDGELKRAFAGRVRQMAEGFAPGDAEPAPVRILEDAGMTLVEWVAEWPKQRFREGREQRVREGIERGLELGVEQGLARQQALSHRQEEHG